MKSLRRQFLPLATAAAVTEGTASGTVAEDAYPSRPVHMIVGYTASGVSDIVARWERLAAARYARLSSSAASLA